MATLFFDFQGGNNANDGTTFANRKKSFNGLTPGAGDVWKVMETRADYSLGNATFTDGSAVITLSSAKTLTIDNCDTAWTGRTNSTASQQTTSAAGSWRQGTGCSRLAIAAGFTTGICGHHATGTLNLSGYTCISLRFYHSAQVLADTLRIDLCSDTAGATPVNSFTIPPLVGSGAHNLFFDNGGALGSAIQSIAITALLDPGTLTIEMDNIIACQNRAHANHLCHDTLVGKLTVEEPELYPIRCINGTTVSLGDARANPSTTRRVFKGASGTADLRAICPARAESSGTVASSLNQVTISGGWDATAMTTQTGRTFITGWGYHTYLLGNGSGSAPEIIASKLNGSGFAGALLSVNATPGGRIDFEAEYAVDNVAILDQMREFALIDINHMSFNQGYTQANSTTGAKGVFRFRGDTWFGCGDTSVGLTKGTTPANIGVRDNVVFEIGKISNCAIGFGGGWPGSVQLLRGCTFADNASDLPTVISGVGNIYLDECSGFDWTDWSSSNNAGSVSWRKRGGVDEDSGVVTGSFFCVTQQTTVPATGDTWAWQYGGVEGHTTARNPSLHPIARFAVQTGFTYSISFDGQRTHTTLTGVVQVTHDGVTYSDEIDGSAGSWATYSGGLSFTATEDGYVDIMFGGYGSSFNTRYAYLANLVIDRT